MKSIKLYFTLAMSLCLVLIVSCGESEKNNAKGKQSDSDGEVINQEVSNTEVETSDTAKNITIEKDSVETSNTEREAGPSKNKVEFIIEHKEDADDDSMPSSDISISVNGEKIFLKNVAGRATIQNNIGDENAITACGSWWGGAGTYFYVTQVNNVIFVYKGWMDEGQSDDGYHWEKIKTINN